VNENGGLNGHRVRVIVAEDGSTPAGFQSKAQQLVEEEGVIGFAFTTLGVTAGGNNSYLDSVGVPMFGTEGGSTNAYESPYVLTAIPVGDLFAESSMYGFARAVKERGISKVAALSCSDFSVCETIDRTWANPELQRAAGLQVVYRARPSLTQPDFTGICIDARNAGAEAILNALDSATVNRLVDSCARQGYHPIVGVPDLFGRPELSGDPDNEGLVVTTRQAPWNDMRVPGNVEMKEAFAQFAPGVEVNGSHALAWLSARFLQATASQLPADNPTAKDLMAGLAHLNGTTLGGMTYPLSFTPGQPSPRRTCFGAAVVKDRTFVPAAGEPLECT
jgi:ABC-type branched-subunit amino acid transport system substrate-binding protein